MKKVIILCLIAFVAMFGACDALGQTNDAASEPVELSKDEQMLDGEFTISMPDNWMKEFSHTDEEMLEQDMILSMTDNDRTFMQVYFYDNEYYDYPLNLAMQDNLDYYGENIIGEYQETTVDDMDSFTFEYSMIELSIDNIKLNYHGYEYLINTPRGVIDIDIFISQEIFESKIIKPTEQQLELLRRIAQSFVVN